MSDEPSSVGPGDPMHPGDEGPSGAPGTGENVCRDCAGSGRLRGDVCPTCGGSGVVIEGISGG